MRVVFAQGKRIGRKYVAMCHTGCKMLKIYAPEKGSKDDDLYEIGGVCATREEFRKLFRMAGIFR